MMTEHKLQRDFLVPLFTKELKYRAVSPNTVNTQMIIKSDLIEYLKKSQNETYVRLLKAFKNDEKLLLNSLVEEIEKRVQKSRNMALFFKNNASITFEDEQVYLWGKSGRETVGDKAFEENIFSVVPEYTYLYKYKNEKIFEFRPDVTLFLNGIYLGFIELKSRDNNQTAQENGIKKVKEDYKRAVSAYKEYIEKDYALTDKQKEEYKKDLLKVFHKAITIATTDLKETYIIRDIARYVDEILVDEEKLLKAFKAYPTITESVDIRDKVREVFTAHFSHKMIEKEILFYNFIERDVKEEKGKKGKKVFKDETGVLISPRPKQKFGVDKIMAKIDEFMAHEDEPNYFINKLKEELKDIPQKQRDELIAKRMSFKNNQNVYSLLLQYAAGFGKSNIIGWCALQLKDLRADDGKFIYDKIMIVVDRLQLRDQLDTKLFNMNIDNSMYVEAFSKKAFHKALEDEKRIIIVNIQKFNFLEITEQKILDDLAKSRTVFLIDEIHRSNNGDQNEKMLDTFSDIDTMFNQDEYTKKNPKKNLIIGFTATPSETTLARFGEFGGYAENEKIWRPFDSYTMNQAIKDGFIYDPTENIKYVSAQMKYSLDERKKRLAEAKAKKISIRKKDIYENEERIEDIAKYIVDDLIRDTYTQIGKRGKAMLATTSIKSAKMYKKKIEEYYEKREWTSKTEQYKDAPIYIVFSESQDEGTVKNLNNGLDDVEVLKKFSLARNGIIIVVDMLQTGYDEPRLYTLYLDKEIRGINAIQTISRVVRKSKNKKGCKIVDFSNLNVNAGNIKEAFLQFSDVVVSDFDPTKELENIQKLYKLIKTTAIYKAHYKSYKTRICDDSDVNANVELEMKATFGNYVVNNKELSKEIKQKLEEYLHSLDMINKVLTFDEKYEEECFIAFIVLFLREYFEQLGNHDDKEFVDIEYIKNIGLVEDTQKSSPPPRERKKGKGGAGNPPDILEIIRKRNEDEDEIGKKIEEFKSKITLLFEYVQKHKKFPTLKAKIANTSISRDEVCRDFGSLYNLFVITKKKDAGEFFIKESKDLIDKLCDEFVKEVSS
jgi:type I restriction enzyme R subunit